MPICLFSWKIDIFSIKKKGSQISMFSKKYSREKMAGVPENVKMLDEKTAGHPGKTQTESLPAGTTSCSTSKRGSWK